jgi:hypothetical protein
MTASEQTPPAAADHAKKASERKTPVAAQAKLEAASNHQVKVDTPEAEPARKMAWTCASRIATEATEAATRHQPGPTVV